MQVAPFLHGLLVHSFMSVSEKERETLLEILGTTLVLVRTFYDVLSGIKTQQGGRKIAQFQLTVALFWWRIKTETYYKQT